MGLLSRHNIKSEKALLTRGSSLDMSALETEVRTGRCSVQVNSSREIEVIVPVEQLRITNPVSGTIFVQLGTWKLDGGIRAACMLPCRRRKNEDVPSDVMKKLILSHLQPLIDYVEIQSVEDEVEWEHSAKYGVRRKLRRSVHVGFLRENVELPELGQNQIR